MKRVTGITVGILLALAIAPSFALADEVGEVQQGIAQESIPQENEDATAADGETSAATEDEAVSAKEASDSTAPQQEDFTPAADGQDTAVADEQLAPAVDEQLAPAVGGQLSSTTDEQSAPASGVQSAPAADETSTPAAIAPTTTKTTAVAPTTKTTTAAKTTTQTPAVKSTKAPATIDKLATLVDQMVYRISTTLAAKDTKVLDVSGGSTKSGANVQIYAANNTLSQYWRAEYQGKGVYHLVSYKGGHVLGVQGNLYSGANVSNIDKNNINWKVTKNSDGSFSLAPANKTNLRLDVKSAKTKNGTNVWVYKSNGTKAQKFFFVEQPGLAEAWKLGKTTNPGVVEISLLDNEQLRVDIAGGSSASGANVQLAKDTKALSQKFQMNYIGNGLYEFQDANSGKCLDVAGGSNKAGANVQQYNKNNTVAQYWYFKPVGKGYQIKSAASGLALDTKNSQANAGANVQIAKVANTATQKYKLQSAQLVDNGTYVIQSSLVMPMVLDVAGGSKASGANLQLWRSNGTDAQKFKITHLGNGIYSIVGVGSGNYVNVAGGSAKSGANVNMQGGTISDAQKWRIEIGDNGLMFKSVKSGKYLDVSGARVNKGTNLQQYNGNKTKAQCFVLHDANWTFYPKGTNVNDLRIIVKAEEYDGWRYRWGGRRPSTSFDCAGLVMYCSNAVYGTNYDLMMTNAEKLYSLCKPIAAKDAKVGDLVFYRGTYGSNVNYISHVVIYAGRGIMYGAGDPIGYSAVNSITNIRGKQAAYMYARIRR